MERVYGPTKQPTFDNLHVRRFGVTIIKDGGWRLILDLSFPNGCSVNDGISKDDFSLTYSEASDAISLIIETRRRL